MTKEFWQDRLERCPGLRPWLLRAVRRAAAGEALPATLTLGEVPQEKAVRRALEEIFPGCREEAGRLKARLEDGLRNPVRWQPLVELLGVAAQAAKPSNTSDALVVRTLQRLKLLHPDACACIDTLRDSESILRFFRSCPTASDDLVRLFDALAALRAAPTGITLSELGATCFNDSKALRAGARRQQLEHLIRVQAGNPDDPPETLLAAAGVIENPYTAHVVVFAPFSYRTRAGEWLDWPHCLWSRGEAALLSCEAVRGLTAVRLEAPCPCLTTSENAAPYLRLVERLRPGLYTEGYPNAAVRTLLRRFAQEGVTAVHWGDSDLDGLRIAEQIARVLPTRLYMPPDAETLARARLPLDDAQRRRAERFLDNHPDFPYADRLRHTLAHGWLEQEQTMEMFFDV
ncbi:MAG: DUF2399 domain-containing protein [Lentisphaerae bacterium]|nr:DUF2399 domain-containing protein [Lentisphaerota bacterium]